MRRKLSEGWLQYDETARIWCISQCENGLGHWITEDFEAETIEQAEIDAETYLIDIGDNR